jgi:hypothetical protein
MILESAKALLHGVVDYAGLFPPAGLGMSEAILNYRRYASSSERWMLARFVLPVSRLSEFQTLVVSEPLPEPWKLSALAGDELAESIPAVLAFNAHVRDAQIDTIEAKAPAPDAIREQARAVPDGFVVYWEIPGGDDPAPWLHAIARWGTGPRSEPAVSKRATFPAWSRSRHSSGSAMTAKTPFKATAGLHHAIRGTHRLTYEENAATCTMHGFLNVFLAAAFLWAGIGEEEMAALLGEGEGAFRFSRMGVAWRQHWVSNAQIQSARERLAVGFGSCSFEEPVAELTAMRLL